MYRVSSKRRQIPEAELATFCQRFADAPWDGYCRFLREFGEGTYCDFMRILSPSHCLAETEANRKLYREHNFWDDEVNVLTQAERAESVTLGMSIDGDILVAHPKNRDQLFVVSRHDSLMFWTPASLAEPMHWMSLRGDKLTTPSFEYFTPHVDRGYIEFGVRGTESTFATLTDFAVRDSRAVSDPMLSQSEKLQIGLLSKLAGRYQSYLSGDHIRMRVDYDTDFAGLLSPLPDRLAKHGFHCYGESA